MKNIKFVIVIIVGFFVDSSFSSSKSSNCPVDSAKTIPSGSISVVLNGGWTIGGWGYASPFNSKNFGDSAFNWGDNNIGWGNFGTGNQGRGNYGSNNLGDFNLGTGNVGRGNCGNYNVGAANNGTWNVGVGNSGDYNLGRGNVGEGNTGLTNSGASNVGIQNSGQGNLGLSNQGSLNIGINNVGVENTGWSNTGEANSGASNVGNGNLGLNNSGSFNIGYFNAGLNNTGAWNYGNGNVGYLGGVQVVNFGAGAQIGGTIDWKQIEVVQRSPLLAVNVTGWANVNGTNVGMAQDGYRLVGYSNVGLFNIGYGNNGTELTGTDLTVSPGVSTAPVTMNGVSSIQELLESSVSGFMNDLVVPVYPVVFETSLDTARRASLSTLNPSIGPNCNRPPLCPTFEPISVANSFSVNFRCGGSLKITDIFCPGDSFNVYKDGKLWLSSPTVDPVAECIDPLDTPEAAFYDDRFSHVIGWLPGGSYKITIEAKVSRWGGGGVAVKADDFCNRTALGNYAAF